MNLSPDIFQLGINFAEGIVQSFWESPVVVKYLLISSWIGLGVLALNNIAEHCSSNTRDE